MNGIPARLDYPEWSMCEAVEQAAGQYPDHIAYDFMGRHTSYRTAVADIHACARALRAAGVQENDRVTDEHISEAVMYRMQDREVER